ncbi:MAG: hypothetical protein H6702_12190 [Myxococcales bacterium]|nr:hypothetical protein [Myxococcales bacterium]
MSEFIIDRFTGPAGHTRIASGQPFEVEVVVEDDDLEGGPCPVSLSVQPKACSVSPRSVLVDVPVGDAQGHATATLVLTGPAGTACRLFATLPNGQQRRLRLMIGEAPA